MTAISVIVGPDWLDQHVVPDIQNMLVQDAYFGNYALDVPSRIE
jgi:hypothetical protein